MPLPSISGLTIRLELETAMKKPPKNAGVLTRLMRDERGAEGLEKLLIIAAIVLPLLGVLLYFKGWLVEWLADSAEQVKDDSDLNNQTDPFN